jgi:hypothetical protein
MWARYCAKISRLRKKPRLPNSRRVQGEFKESSRRVQGEFKQSLSSGLADSAF